MIWANKFIDFELLLPTQDYSDPKYTSTCIQIGQDSAIAIVPQQKRTKIYTVEMWTTAFLRFVAIYSIKCPHETGALMKYGEIVWDLAIKRSGTAWQQYDRQFRLLREQTPFPWDRLHTEFWLMACLQPTTTFRPFRSTTPKQFTPASKPFNKSRSNKFLDNTCWPFNSRGGLCKYPGCKHTHVCGYCKAR